RGARRHDRDATRLRDGVARDRDQRSDAAASDEQPVGAASVRLVKHIAFVLLAAAVHGCASGPPADQADSRYAPAYPDAYAVEREPGTIYAAGSFDLFMDLRARAVGDTLTILLVERTAASKES